MREWVGHFTLIKSNLWQSQSLPAPTTRPRSCTRTRERAPHYGDDVVLVVVVTGTKSITIIQPVTSVVASRPPSPFFPWNQFSRKNFVKMIVDLYCRFVVLALFGGGHASAYFADWSSLAEGEQPTCVAIPANMSLCNNIRKFTCLKNFFRIKSILNYLFKKEIRCLFWKLFIPSIKDW